MIRLRKILLGAAFSGLASCAQITGLSQYLTSNDSDAGPMRDRRAGGESDAFAEGPNESDAFGEESTESDAFAEGSDEADVGNGNDADTGGSAIGQSAAGGMGGASRNSAQGLAGAPQGTGPVPLTGGCAGGLPFTGVNLNYFPADGAGGGGVQIAAAGAVDLSSGTINVSGSGGGNGEASKCTQPSSVPENGTGGAGGGSGGTILIEGASITGGSLVAAGGPGGGGGAAPPPTSKAGGTGGAGGNAGAPGMPGGPGVYTVDPTRCNAGGSWSGGGGGGGGYVKTVAHGCACTQDSDCSSALCSNVSSQCGAGACTGTTTAGTYDSLNCQYAVTTSSTR